MLLTIIRLPLQCSLISRKHFTQLTKINNCNNNTRIEWSLRHSFKLGKKLFREKTTAWNADWTKVRVYKHYTNIVRGVPQASAIGLSLFNMCISNMFNCNKISSFLTIVTYLSVRKIWRNSCQHLHSTLINLKKKVKYVFKCSSLTKSKFMIIGNYKSNDYLEIQSEIKYIFRSNSKW